MTTEMGEVPSQFHYWDGTLDLEKQPNLLFRLDCDGWIGCERA